MSKIRQKLGCWLYERWKAEIAILAPSFGKRISCNWSDLCNRCEQLKIESSTGGRICCWQDSSQLTLARVFPNVAKRLFDHCFSQWPIELNNQYRKSESETEVSVLIPIGGSDRLDQLSLVLDSLASQVNVAFEIIVIEQSMEPQLSSCLPEGIRHLHTKTANDTIAFNKSWALNVGARQAQGKTLVIHDADYLAPSHYLTSCHEALKHHDAVLPARFIFHANQETTLNAIDNRPAQLNFNISDIIQNNPTPMAVKKETYWNIGGHDESFFGWGGEDIEFLSRLKTAKLSRGGFLPLVHLWHPPALQKQSGHRNSSQQSKRLGLPIGTRINALRKLELGKQFPIALDEQLQPLTPSVMNTPQLDNDLPEQSEHS